MKINIDEIKPIKFTRSDNENKIIKYKYGNDEIKRIEYVDFKNRERDLKEIRICTAGKESTW